MATWQAVNRMRVGERYEIEETIEGTKEIERRVVERGRRERARFYDPWEFPEIVSEFATKVQFNDDAGLLDFTHRWGSLRETLDITHQVPGGDPVGYAEQHAAIVRFSLELIALIR
ncbi:MAG: hypothetical protein O2913_12995, partial [Chloroflexi bacterium]|nr:hypothetical protein [Chloroflexota bacterium]